MRRRRWILIVCSVLTAAAVALWWRLHSTGAALAAFVKTVQDAGFHVRETSLIDVPEDLDTDIPILGVVLDELFSKPIAEITIESDDDARRLRALVEDCPSGTCLDFGVALSKKEQHALLERYPDAEFMEMATVPPLASPAFNPIRPFGAGAPAATPTASPAPAPTQDSQ
jgi:hypothetical protein